MEKNPMTPEGAQKLREELAHRKGPERAAISHAIGVARELGDLSENAEYHAARERQGLNEARIRDLEDKLARIEIIDPTKLSGDRVLALLAVSLIGGGVCIALSRPSRHGRWGALDCAGVFRHRSAACPSQTRVRHWRGEARHEGAAREAPGSGDEEEEAGQGRARAPSVG